MRKSTLPTGYSRKKIRR